MICPLDCLLFFFIYFSKNVDWVNFVSFFLSYNNVQFMSREIQTFNQTFSRASVNNEINWKLEGTNRKLTRKAYELLFFSSRISFFNFFLFLYFFNNLASNIISFLLKKTLFLDLSSREPFMESSNNCTCSKTDKEYVITRLVLFCNIVQLWIDYEDVSSTTTTMKL